jgi:tetratricopeptide (TPR) repeat protein
MVAAGLVCLGFTASCSRRPAPELTREVFLTFDNLTGDASLDWMAQAAPKLLESDLTGLPKTISLTAAAVRDAYLERATRLVHGYFEMRSGKLHFEIEVEDAAGHRMIQTAAEDGEFSDALNRAAKILDPAARTFPASPAGVTAWGQGQYERAVMLDPDFALAWLGWIEQIAASPDPARANQAREVAERALARPGLRSPIDRARLELAAAGLRQDDAARLAASRELVALIPADPALIGILAELEMNLRHFPDAVRHYQDFALADPGNLSAKNMLGYAQAFAGDLDGARKSFEQYGRQPGQAVNSLDSLGEALFVNGKFDQAERAFLAADQKAADQKDPAFLQGEELWKAAHARWLAGDLPGADQLMERYWQDRAKVHDNLLVWRRANWLYETGHREQAVELLMHAPPEAEQAAQRQLQVWNNLQSIPSDLAALEKDYQHSNPVSDGLVRTLYAEALVRAGRKADARSLVQRWPLPEQNALLQALMYPKFIELRRGLQP